MSQKKFKYDILSGFIVSLIALPLCLGVASASNFPPIAGVITAIIGGLIIGFISGSELAIKGPAAGLIVIVAGAVDEFGRGDTSHGYILTASLIAVTGAMQIILGFLKVGKWSDFIPSSVVHGMLAAIGIIIMSKQIHLLIGITPAEIKGMEPLELIKEIPISLGHIEWHIALIGIFSLTLLFLLPKIKNPLIKAVPPFLIVIAFSILIAQIFHFSSEKRFYNALIHPGNLEVNFFFNTEIFRPENIGITLKYFFLLTIIGTIESILTVKAVDILDPRKRTSNYNKDIVAIGVGNLLCGLVGALPMISEVARSSANINNKGITKLSNISHGAFLCIFVFILASVIKLIPVAALSSILIFVGLKLANPKDFIKLFKIGNEHFIVFLTTTIFTVSVDILVGVACGIALKILINFLKVGRFGTLFKAKVTVESTEKQAIIYLDSAAVFTNWLATKKILQKENGKKIVVDFSRVIVIDSSFIDNISRYKESYTGELILRSLQELQPLKNHPNAMRVRSIDGEVMTIKLTTYQRSLKTYCEEKSLILSFSPVIPRNYFASFKSFKHSDLKQTDLYVIGHVGKAKFEYLEGLMYDPVDMIEYQVNIIQFDFGDKIVPKFQMQRETKLDTVIEFFAKNQVVFEDHPVFNQTYSIYSREHEKVKNIFTGSVINFLEQHDIKDEVIEGNNENKLIIYNNGKCQNVNSFEFKLELATLLYKQFNQTNLAEKEKNKNNRTASN